LGYITNFPGIEIGSHGVEGRCRMAGRAANM
jgi:hypothetical protein